jgi:cysteine desulfurase
LGAAAAVTAICTSLGRVRETSQLRDRLERALIAAIPGLRVNGDHGERAPNVANLYFPGRNAADLVAALSRRGVYVSAAAACSTGGEPSHVLRAMGLEERANASVRFSLSRFTTAAEIDYAVRQIRDAVAVSLPVSPEPVSRKSAAR